MSELLSNSVFVGQLYEDKSLAMHARDLIFTTDLQTVNYTQKKKFSQYLCLLIKSTILDIPLSNCIHELYYRTFTCTCLLCDK